MLLFTFFLFSKKERMKERKNGILDHVLTTTMHVFTHKTCLSLEDWVEYLFSSENGVCVLHLCMFFLN